MYFRIDVNPKKKNMIFCSETLQYMYEHFLWATQNIKGHWYNECDEYNYLIVKDLDDALSFNREYGKNKMSEEQELWFRLRV